jgi:inhibitor of KinA
VSSGFTIYPLGDHAITIEFGYEINHKTNQKVLSLFHYLQTKPFKGLLDLIPAYTTLTVVYDVFQLKQHCQKAQTVYDWLEQHVVNILQTQQLKFSPTKRSVSIPVCYHPTVAPDIEWLATQHNLTTDQVISMHTGTTYHVYMLGFLPGFPYMATVPEKLVTPRKSSPRKLVTAGSVGIAGNQTGIYPFATPGGWQLIGQTPIKIFDVKKKEAALLQPGDQVTFYSISLEEFSHQQQT